MAREYRLVNRDQEFLLPPSMRDWLPAGHLVWFVIEAVDRLDTSAFHARSRLGGVGRRGYDPDMLLTLFVYAMAHGMSSSRKIERQCETDVAFRVICAQDVPDHTVLARFRQVHERALEDLLTASLELAAQLGMVSLGVVALDGTKIAANASKDANRSEKFLREQAAEYVRRAEETDTAEDSLFGEGQRGDELPVGVGDRTNRPRRVAEALEQIEQRKRAELMAEQQQQAKAEAFDLAVADGRPVPGPAPKGADSLARLRACWEREYAAAADRYRDWCERDARARAQTGGGIVGRPVVPPEQNERVKKKREAYEAALTRTDVEQEPQAAADAEGEQPAADARPGHQANLTDPQSRVMKTRNGWIQGFNCQTSASEDGFILTARVTQDTSDVNQFVPTLEAVLALIERLAASPGPRTRLVIGMMLADAGYDTVQNAAEPGPGRLIADTTRRQMRHQAKEASQEPPDPHQPAESAESDQPAESAESDQPAAIRRRMHQRLYTPEGQALYSQRAAIIEPSNAWLKDQRGLRQFSRRGLDAAQSELSFACAVTNLLRLRTLGVTTANLAAAA